MMRCKRGTDDPLLQHFLARRVNLLDPPRTALPLGTTFIVRADDIRDLPLSRVVRGAVDIRPSTAPSEGIEEVRQASSRALSTEGGASVAGAMLAALGFSGTEPGVRTALRTVGARGVIVSLKGLTVARLDREALETSLAGCLVDGGGAHADGRHEYYVTTGTWSALELDLRVEGVDGQYVDASGELGEVLSVGGKVDVRRGNLAETLVRAPKPLVFGVELMRLGRKGDGLILVDRRPDMRMRGEDGVKELALLGDEATFGSQPVDEAP